MEFSRKLTRAKCRIFREMRETRYSHFQLHIVHIKLAKEVNNVQCIRWVYFIGITYKNLWLTFKCLGKQYLKKCPIEFKHVICGSLNYLL